MKKGGPAATQVRVKLGVRFTTEHGLGAQGGTARS